MTISNKIVQQKAKDSDGNWYVAVPALSDKAIKDGAGNTISTTYATKAELTTGKVSVSYNSAYSVIETAIASGGVVVCEFNNHTYYLSMTTSNTTLGKKFAWFATPMNVHAGVNGIQVLEVVYNISAGTTTWSSNDKTWLTKSNADGLYASKSEFEEVQEDVQSIMGANGTPWLSLPSYTESEEDLGRLSKAFEDGVSMIVLTLTKDGAQGALLNGQIVTVDCTQASSPYIVVIVGDAESDSDASNIKINNEPFQGQTNDNGYEPVQMVDVGSGGDTKIKYESDGMNWEFHVIVKVAEPKFQSETFMLQPQYWEEISGVYSQNVPVPWTLDDEHLLIIDAVPSSKRDALDAVLYCSSENDDGTITMTCLYQPSTTINISMTWMGA